MTQLEQDILDIINETIKGKYIGKLEVSNNDGVYALLLYLDRWYTPTVLAYEGTEDEFKKFIKKEFKKNQYQRVSFWETNREIIPIEEIDMQDED